MNNLKCVAFSLCALILSGCAASYKPINPQTVNYGNNTQDKNFTFSYKYGVLQGRYAKRENKNRIKLVSVKMSNNSGRDLIFGKDVKLTYTNNNQLTFADSKVVFDEVKQSTGIYLLYLLLTPARFTSTQNGVQTSSVPVGYVLGPGLTIGNMVAAGSANKNFKKELDNYMISEGALIKNGETKFGLIALSSDNYDNIVVKIE